MSEINSVNVFKNKNYPSLPGDMHRAERGSVAGPFGVSEYMYMHVRN